MSELRWNPVLEEWVITATHRQERTYKPPKDYCPLCPTKKGGFPTEVPAENFEIVVFENKFPSLKRIPLEPEVKSSSLYPVRKSQGICEVILYSSKHEGSLTDFPVDDIFKLCLVWKDRYEELGSLKYIKYVFIFENKGDVIGVTLHHTHGQIYAFPYIPPKIKKELDSGKKYYKRHKRCLFCDIVSAEENTKEEIKSKASSKSRIVYQNEQFIAFIPFFARYPYEVHIYPKKHISSLHEFNEKNLYGLADAIKVVITKYDNLFGYSFPYMMVMHQNPTLHLGKAKNKKKGTKIVKGIKSEDYYHFHIEFYPPMRTKDKIKYLAGCESGAGSFINDTLPEEKAEELRNVKY